MRVLRAVQDAIGNSQTVLVWEVRKVNGFVGGNLEKVWQTLIDAYARMVLTKEQRIVVVFEKKEKLTIF